MTLSYFYNATFFSVNEFCKVIMINYGKCHEEKKDMVAQRDIFQLRDCVEQWQPRNSAIDEVFRYILVATCITEFH